MKPRLTRRETEIMGLAAKGFTREEIAQNLGISPETVKTTFITIRLRLDAQNIVHAVSISLVNGLISI